jgi:hypothetical protein
MVKYFKAGSKSRQIITKEHYSKRYNYSNIIQENPIVLDIPDFLIWPKNQYNLSLGYDTLLIDRKKYLWIHFDWEGGNANEWQAAYRKEQQLNNFPHTIYCTLWEDKYPQFPFDKYVVAIQYWFFYPFNDWANDHEGDWEHINVIVCSQFIEQAYIDKIQFYFHEVWKEWEPTDLEITDGTHVKVYVGGTFMFDRPSAKDGHISGASFPAPGQWKNIANIFDEYVNGSGPLIKWSDITGSSDEALDGRGIEILKDPNVLGYNFFNEKVQGSHPELSWLKANIFFGQPHNRPWFRYLPPSERYDISKIVGPYYSSGWRKLGSSSGFKSYVGK